MTCKTNNSMTSFSPTSAQPISESGPESPPTCAKSSGPRWSEEFIAEMRRDVERKEARRRAHLPAPPGLIPLSHEGEVMRRMNLYAETGNRGYLVDVARYAMFLWSESVLEFDHLEPTGCPLCGKTRTLHVGPPFPEVLP